MSSPARRFQLRSLFLIAALLAPGPTRAAPDDAPSAARAFTAREIAQGHTDRTLLALPHAATPPAALAAAETAAGLDLTRRFDAVGGIRVLTVAPGASVTAARAALAATGYYQFVEFDQLRQVALEPNDPAYLDGRQWHLRNNGLGGVLGADINAPAGWDLRTDASAVIVAVIDSGARLTHRDLLLNLWRNPGEIAGNGRDDDNNGYIDDVHGINARVTGSAAGRPEDDLTSGHGTHVAGIIGAVGNNAFGVSGVTWRVQIMPLKFLGGTDGTGRVSDAIACIDYAIAKGAKIINASYGAINAAQGFSQAELAAVRRARDTDIIFVAAAGNSALNLDLARAYPASFPLDNIVAVGNSTRLDDVAPSSNRGAAVELFAPGSEILSLGVADDDALRTLTGTSMAAPVVTGILALLRAQHPTEDYRQIINRLLRGVEPRPAFRGVALTGGRASLSGALTATSSRPFNDDFAARARLTGNVIAARNSTRGASTEPGEPAHAGLGGPSLWFEWSAPTSGTVTVDTRGSTTDTRLAVYTGTTLNALTLRASNNNEQPGQNTSRLTFEAVAGTPYQIALATTPATPGLVLLNLSAAAANDAFAAAQPLDGDAPLITTTNATATAEPGEPRHAGVGRGRSLWYQWSAPRSGLFQVSAYSPSMDPVVAIYTGNTVTTLTLVATADDSGPANINPTATASFTATVGSTYRIAVDSATAAAGEFTLSLTDALWQFTTGSLSDDLPTITNAPARGPDGTLYVGSSDGHLYAIAPDGTQRWRFQTNGILDSSNAAIAADGTIFFGATDGFAYALHADGTLRWRSAAAERPYFAPPALGADGTAYFKNDDGNLRAFTPDGALRWTYSAPGEGSYSGPTVAPDGTIYFPANDGALHALTPTGTLLWRTFPPALTGGNDTSGLYTSPALDAAGHLYAATLNGTVFSLTPAGTLRWTYRPGGGNENVTSSLALAEGRAYFASYGALLYAINQTDGSLIWTASIEAQARASSPAVAADGSIFVGSYANKLLRFSRDGELLRTWSAGNWFRSSPLLADGRLYIGNGDGKLYAFDLAGVGPAHPAQAPWAQHRASPDRRGRATPEVGGLVFPAAPADPGRLINLSVRNLTRPGADTLIAGFVLGGPPAPTPTKPFFVRGIGPALTPFGVAGALTAARVELYGSENSNTPLAANAGWTITTGDGSAAGGFALAPGTANAVLRPTLAPGAYTAAALPVSGAAPGVALVEIYDAERSALTPPLVNLSARSALAAGGDVTAGFVLEGSTPRTVLIRAVGPSLASFGVPGSLADPRLTLFSGELGFLTNDDWRGPPTLVALTKAVGAFPLPADSRDAVLLATLPPGAYTARVTAPPGQSGVVLLEVYLLAE